MKQQVPLTFGKAQNPVAKNINDLGKVLFEKRAPLAALLYMMAFFVAGSVGAAIGAFYSVDGIQIAFLAFLAVICLLSSAAILYQGLTGVFRCHEFGISGQSGGTKLPLLTFDEIEVLTCDDVDHYRNGVRVASQTRFQFHPAKNSGKQTFNFGFSSMSDGDAKVEVMRQHICELITERLRTRLNCDGTVAWTSNVSFEQDGVTIRTKFDGEQMMPYHGLKVTIFQGECSLVDLRTEKAITAFKISEPNFFPGLNLFNTLCDQTRPPETTSGSSN